MFFFKKNLKNNGKIFVQCSNLDVRPYNLYLADQYFYPTKYSLNKIFKNTLLNLKNLIILYLITKFQLYFLKKNLNQQI